MGELKTVSFIRENPDWESILSGKSYCISVSRDVMFGRNLVMLKYSQLDSDFNCEMVRECRGLILDGDTLEPVCVPFFKFGNYGEPYCPEIDWNNCWVGEKLDGSLVKVVRLGDDLLISTNGTIDAFKAPLAEQIGTDAETFGALILDAIANEFGRHHPGSFSRNVNWFRDLLEENKTYMFELTSPFNRVVVTWHETRLNFLGVRDNRTLRETYFCDHELKNHFKTPKVFPLRNIDECIKAAESLDCNNEGFVVCDGNFNRVKVKSPLYVAIHHLRGENGVMSYRRALEIIRKNEVDEVLTYFPEYGGAFEDIRLRFGEKAGELGRLWEEFKKEEPNLPTRKDKAIWITSRTKTPGLLFAMLDGRISSVESGLMSMSDDNVLKMIGLKDR